MKIKADFLRVRTVPYDDRGHKVEPEQQPVQRILTSESDATMRGGATVGKIPTQIIYETTAGQMATAMRAPCFSCKNFDQVAWKKLMRVWGDDSASKEHRAQLNTIRAALLQTQNATIRDSHVAEGDMDVEHALSALGVCHVLSEIRKDVLIVYPTTTCPDEVCSPERPNGLHDPKDKESERMGSKVFDNVMALAQGKRV